MNTVYVIIFVVILMCVVEQICGSVEEFFKNVHNGIGDAFGSAWESLKKAVKKPVKIKRLGRGRRRKTTPKKTTLAQTTQMVIPSTPSEFYIKAIEVPYITAPEWRGIQHWNMLQLPRYVLKKLPDYDVRRYDMDEWAIQYEGPTHATSPVNC